MKIAKGFFSSRESMAKKALKRSKQRIEEHITLSSAFQPKDSAIIKENLDPIARYADRNRINIAFEPSSENLSAPKMEVSRRVIKQTEPYDGSDPIIYMVPERAGSVVLPEGINNKQELLKTIRTEAAKILYENK
ncbi:MAG: hypothetical protein K6E29_06360 [Cyanobacteria bacterium RUI128]|nr:hypothetical protein [Cyanobacteria bacterium RUI128]